MNALLFFISLLTGFAAFTVIYIMARPYLEKGGRNRHLTALISVHLFRYLGLVGLLPGILDLSSLNVDRTFAYQMAFGDLLTALLAIASIVAIRRQISLAIPLIWVFSIVGLADLINVGIIAMPRLVDPNILGSLGWLLFTVYLPALILTHGLIIRLLLLGSQEAATEIDGVRITQGRIG